MAKTGRRPSTALMPVGRDQADVFQRLAANPKLTVEKLGELIKLHERVQARSAQQAFDAAFLALQPEIPTIAKTGRILNKAGEVQSRYSRYEDIRQIIDPILRRRGFSFHSRTEWPETGILEVVGLLTHEGGHTRESRFRASADTSGNKNGIQGLGSATAYGRRYTLKDLLAIVEQGADDDGQRVGRRDLPVSAHRDSREVITQAQRQRLQVILKNAGRNKEDVRAWLQRRYGWSSSGQITRDVYDAVCRAIESRQPLPERDPGEEG